MKRQQDSVADDELHVVKAQSRPAPSARTKPRWVPHHLSSVKRSSVTRGYTLLWRHEKCFVGVTSELTSTICDVPASIQNLEVTHGSYWLRARQHDRSGPDGTA